MLSEYKWLATTLLHCFTCKCKRLHRTGIEYTFAGKEEAVQQCQGCQEITLRPN